MRPISKKLLIHTVTLYKKISIDKWGSEKLDTGQTLSNIRIEPSKQIIRDKNNAEVQLAATLFYDCRNSRPSDVSFLYISISVRSFLEAFVLIIEWYMCMNDGSIF